MSSSTMFHDKQLFKTHYLTVALPNIVWKASRMAPTLTSLSEATMISMSPPEPVDNIPLDDMPSKRVPQSYVHILSLYLLISILTILDTTILLTKPNELMQLHLNFSHFQAK